MVLKDSAKTVLLDDDIDPTNPRRLYRPSIFVAIPNSETGIEVAELALAILVSRRGSFGFKSF